MLNKYSSLLMKTKFFKNQAKINSFNSNYFCNLSIKRTFKVSSKSFSQQKEKENTTQKTNTEGHPPQTIVEPSFLQMVQLYFDEAFKVLNIPDFYKHIIKPCAATLIVNFPLVRDNGTIEVIQGYRAEHSMHYLPTKG